MFSVALPLLSLFSPLVLAAIEEAPYTVTQEHQGWEERWYPATKWVSTDAVATLPHNGAEGTEVGISSIFFVRKPR